MKTVSNLLPQLIGEVEISNKIEIKNNSYESFIKYPNGNLIKVLPADDTARGQRFNGIIVDSQITEEVVNTIILPHLMPLATDNNMYDSNDKPMDRVYYCKVSELDVIESEKYKRLIYISSAYNEPLHKYQKDMLDAMSYNIRFKNNNYISFEREYECMWNENAYDRPVVEKELNGNKIMLYEAWGIPKDMITYSTEFINKTKQTYLNIVGEFKNEVIGFENDINVHLYINTDIYDGYEVNINDGLVTVVLHEIKNEAPVLKDYGA